MLAIRLNRIGRKAHAIYRVAVQEANRHPSSGRVVEYVGSYDPHTKIVNFDKEAVEKYLSNGAQPTTRVVKLLVDAKIKLPKWVKTAPTDKKRAIRNPEKLRKNQPKEEKVVEAVVEEAPVVETETVEPAVAEAAEPVEEAKAEETPTE
ncbi:30S ribosomal protein S16 [Candidatus Saccharibacteria bacterium]|nr:30S ribosomal protein S16 [Candidatus Saccharibacteria bacterium]MCL1963340.1 30S ribosomal protein S16 [Candidatus Saccharibacteria bacterium]